jgi:hypothetical protein
VDKGIIMWMVFLAVIAAGMLISHRIKSEINENGIETDAVVSRVIDDGTPEEIDIDVYVRYRTENGEEIEGILQNPRADMAEGQPVRIKYHPKYKNNARLI